jgi:ABC-type nitrate/sulfonate/bicarbonate transport system ATPase subunit
MVREHLLRVEGLSKEFPSRDGQRVRALDALSFHVDEGEFVTLLGPSGCGKSTTFNIIAGLSDPSAGHIYLHDTDVTGQTGFVGYMFQKDLLLPWRTVLGNMILGAEAQGQDRRGARKEATTIIERLGLKGRENAYPSQLSGGMRQRVAFGRTLLYHKDLLLLDEPLGALDAQTREYMQEWLLEIWTEVQKTVLLISHDLDEAIFLSDRIYVLTKQPGRIKAEIKVDLPRPRTVETRLSPSYAETRLHVYRLIREEETEI